MGVGGGWAGPGNMDGSQHYPIKLPTSANPTHAPGGSGGDGARTRGVSGEFGAGEGMCVGEREGRGEGNTKQGERVKIP